MNPADSDVASSLIVLLPADAAGTLGRFMIALQLSQICLVAQEVKHLVCEVDRAQPKVGLTGLPCLAHILPVTSVPTGVCSRVDER